MEISDQLNDTVRINKRVSSLQSVRENEGLEPQSQGAAQKGAHAQELKMLCIRKRNRINCVLLKKPETCIFHFTIATAQTCRWNFLKQFQPDFLSQELFSLSLQTWQITRDLNQWALGCGLPCPSALLLQISLSLQPWHFLEQSNQQQGKGGVASHLSQLSTIWSPDTQHRNMGLILSVTTTVYLHCTSLAVSFPNTSPSTVAWTTLCILPVAWITLYLSSALAFLRPPLASVQFPSTLPSAPGTHNFIANLSLSVHVWWHCCRFSHLLSIFSFLWTVSHLLPPTPSLPPAFLLLLSLPHLSSVFEGS